MYRPFSTSGKCTAEQEPHLRNEIYEVVVVEYNDVGYILPRPLRFHLKGNERVPHTQRFLLGSGACYDVCTSVERI